MINFKISGTGSYIPEKIVTNEDYAKFLDTSDEWITTRTGIKTRHIATDIAQYQMAVEAGRKALEKSGISPEDIDMVITTTTTSEYRFPAVACVVQGELGLKNAFCFDIAAACTAFIYALDVVSQYFYSGRVKNVLLISSEKLSSVTNYADRSLCVLFGDAAGAVVLSADNESGLLSSYIKSDGTGVRYLTYKNIQSKSPWQGDIPDKFQVAPEGIMTMEGREVYKFAVKAMCEACEEAMAKAGVTPDQIAAVLPHQANIRIINSAIQKLGIGAEKYHNNIEEYGNTSSATIPLLLDRVISQKLVKKGDLILMTAFGGGLTYGANIFKI